MVKVNRVAKRQDIKCQNEQSIKYWWKKTKEVRKTKYKEGKLKLWKGQNEKTPIKRQEIRRGRKLNIDEKGKNKLEKAKCKKVKEKLEKGKMKRQENSEKEAKESEVKM